jgi:hypothetical protein
MSLRSKQMTRDVISLIMGIWGVALFCLAMLDWIGYQRFFVELLFGARAP